MGCSEGARRGRGGSPVPGPCSRAHIGSLARASHHLPAGLCWGRGERSGRGPALASTVAGTPRDAFVAVNNGPTGLLGMSPWGPRGRHADPAAGGCPALCPPGDPRNRFPSTSVQVSAPPWPCAPPLCPRPRLTVQSRHLGVQPSPCLAPPHPVLTTCPPHRLPRNCPPCLRPEQGVREHRRPGVCCGHGHSPELTGSLQDSPAAALTEPGRASVTLNHRDRLSPGSGSRKPEIKGVCRAGSFQGLREQLCWASLF